jgi:hypothetical protein
MSGFGMVAVFFLIIFNLNKLPLEKFLTPYILCGGVFGNVVFRAGEQVCDLKNLNSSGQKNLFSEKSGTNFLSLNQM